ncbi:hypothetical protein [Streptomyces caatingaensis]|uniref:hypothetical protein n=1 Tax=Streptomyces caatingaensis TaxID=1678637 RepID=UPI00067285AE|nr:hypothetical protein [Streptomyces caatingaensis]
MSGVTAVPLDNQIADRLLRAMYRRSGAWLLDQLGLVSAQSRGLSGYGPVNDGIAFAVNPQFEPLIGNQSVVVGGACLTNCDARLERLRTEFVVDTVQPLLLAAWARVPCMLFLPIGEEIIISNSSITVDAWRRFGDQVEAFVNSIAASIPGGHPPILIRTDSDTVSATLDTAVEAVSNLITATELADLYAIRPSSSGQTPPSAARLRQYRRSIVTYMPSVVAELLGCRDVQRVVVAENLHQAKAVRTARSVSAAIGSHSRIDHLAHVPAPSVTGSSRMARAEDRSVLFCLDTEGVRAEKLQRITPTVRRYWESAWRRALRPDGTAMHGDPLKAVFDEWRQLLVQVADPQRLEAPSDSTVSEGAT